MYYMTNYIIKYDVSQYQMIIIITLIKCLQKEAEKVTDFSERDLRFKYQDMKKFTL